MSDPHSRVPARTAVHELRRRATELAAAAHVPYSERREGAALLLSDGSWVGGARIDSVAFPLTIPALQAAWVAAVGAGRHDIVAAVVSRPTMLGEWGWLGIAVGEPGEAIEDDAIAFTDTLPEVRDRLDVRLDVHPPADDAEGVGLARAAASRAHTPYSDYPVGCVLLYELAQGGAVLVPGVNVEHPDWTRGLCAERSAIATAFSLGPGTIRRAYLSCLRDADGTPCGACRQLLMEHLPDGPLAIDRGSETPARRVPRDLLPEGFGADRLGN